MIRLASSPRRWIGLSTDGKPVPGQTTISGDTILASDVTTGSTFFETDTNITSTWNGSAWVAGPLQDDKVLQQLMTNGDELFRIRRLLEEANGLLSDDLL